MDHSGGSVFGAVMMIDVNLSGISIPLSISNDLTVRDLKSLLHPLTFLLIRDQRLVFNGKVLKDEMTLKSSELTHGSKIMLVSSQRLHQGHGRIIKKGSVATRPQRIASGLKQAMCLNLTPAKRQFLLRRWKRNGVVPLQDRQMEVIPNEVWNIGTSVKELDLSMNCLREIPAQIGSLSSLQKLYLTANEIEDSCISWEAVASLKGLQILSLNKNYLTTLPSSLGSLTNLKELRLASNQLSGLPIEIGCLSQLQILKANSNRLSSIPSSIGNCKSLAKIDLASNLLVELPETFKNLLNLKDLYLANNGLKSIPPALLKKCSKLISLDVRGTYITSDVLHGMEGWEEFDKRCQIHNQMQICFNISSRFDGWEDVD